MTSSKTRKTAHIVDTVEALQTQVNGKADNQHTHTISEITNLQTQLNDLDTDITAKIPLSQKGASSGVASLDGNGHIPSNQLPSFVDDVMEYTNMASFPTTGEASKIYVDLNTNRIYRWGGSQYTEISPGGPNADTAVTLATPRTISMAGDGSGSVTFDGSSDVSLTLTVADDSHSHAIATSSAAGFMSASHATRVNNMRQNPGPGLDKDPVTQRFTHGATSSVTSASNTGATFIQALTFDTYGHVTAATSTDVTSVVTPANIGAAAAAHNHNGVYAPVSHSHVLSDITADAGLNMMSNSVTGVTNLSANSLVLASGGTFTSSANWAQGGTSSFTGSVTIDADTTVNDGSLTVESDNLSSSNPTININALDQSNIDRGFSLAFDASDSRKFEMYFPDVDSNGGKSKVIHQDEDGGIFIQPKGSVDGMRFVQDGSFQFGWNGTTNGSDLLGSSSTGTGVQFRHDGWTAISSGHTRGLDINMRVTANSDGTYPTRDPLYFRHNGSFAGSFRYNSSNVVFLNTPSDERIKDDIEDLTGALDAISSLSPKTYRFKAGGDQRQPGLIAQQVEGIEAFADAVFINDTEEMSDMRSINYSFFIPHLIAAFKEANEKINRLEEKIEKLQA